MSRPHEIIDAADLVVCPGFIDVHSHSDAAIYFDNTLPSTIRQGITTSLLGNCGDNLAPLAPETRQDYLKLYGVFAPPGFSFEAVPWNTFGEYLDLYGTAWLCRQRGPSGGVGYGAGGRRAGISKIGRRRPAKIKRMQSFVAQAMQAGALPGKVLRHNFAAHGHE